MELQHRRSFTSRSSFSSGMKNINQSELQSALAGSRLPSWVSVALQTTASIFGLVGLVGSGLVILTTLDPNLLLSTTHQYCAASSAAPCWVMFLAMVAGLGFTVLSGVALLSSAALVVATSPSIAALRERKTVQTILSWGWVALQYIAAGLCFVALPTVAILSSVGLVAFTPVAIVTLLKRQGHSIAKTLMPWCWVALQTIAAGIVLFALAGARVLYPQLSKTDGHGIAIATFLLAAVLAVTIAIDSALLLLLKQQARTIAYVALQAIVFVLGFVGLAGATLVSLVMLAPGLFLSHFPRYCAFLGMGSGMLESSY